MEQRGSTDPPPRTLTRDGLPRSFIRNGLTRTATRNTAMTQGFGGFPNPVKAIASVVQKRLIPRSATLDMPRTTTLQSVHSNGGLSDFAGAASKPVTYISFDAIVGRNSRFYSLTSAQRDELGGVEYRVRSCNHAIKDIQTVLIFVRRRFQLF